MCKKLLLLFLLVFGVGLSAEVKDKFKINIGTMYITNFETEMAVSKDPIPLSVGINTQEQLNMKSDTNVLSLGGYYRFSDAHSIDFSYFSVNSKGHISLTQEIEWGDKTIGAGAYVDSFFDIDIYKLSYGYSFYHNDKVELVITAGLHITDIDLGISANGNIERADGSVVPSDYYAETGNGILPLPVVGFKGQYTILDKRLFVNYKFEYFYLKYDDYEGRITSSELNFEYHFVDHVGIGIGYNSNKIFAEMDDGDLNVQAANDLEGALVYFTYIY